MAVLSAEQLADIRFDMDLPSDPDVFTNAQLQRLFTRAGEDYATTVAYAWRALLASASKMADYKAAQSGESLSQLYTHVKDMLKSAEKTAGISTSVAVVNLIGLNIDATADNQSEWDGSA